MSKSSVVLEKDMLYQRYITENMKISEIAALYGVSVGTVHKYLRKYDALNKDYVSLTDMVEEIYRITGERYVLTEADIYDRWKKGCASFGVLLESVRPFSKERY